MSNPLTLRITPARFDAVIAWLVGFVLLSFCTTLVLKMLPELSLAISTVLVLSLSGVWLVIGWQLPAVKHAWSTAR